MRIGIGNDLNVSVEVIRRNGARGCSRAGRST